jgi:hypothetical protein
MSRWPILLLVLCALTGGLVACGGDDSDDVDQILSETFGEGKDVKSGRLALAFRLDAQGLQNLRGPVALRLNGPFASQGRNQLPRFDFQVALDAGGQTLTAGAVSTGEKGFVRFQDQAYALSDQLYQQFRKGYADQAKCSQEQGGEGVSFSSLGIRPGQWLRDAKTAGSEKVGGVETTHITAGVDVPKLLEDVNRILGRTEGNVEDPCAKEQKGQPQRRTGRQLSEQDRKAIADAVKDARVDVWTGEDDRVMRRINVAIRFDVPEDQRERVRGLRSGALRFDMTIGGLNEKQDIKTPTGARPLDDLVAQFGGQVPGLGGASGGSSQQGGSATQPQQQQQQPESAYLQCVQEAGQDVVKLQQCRDLIGQ